MDTAVYDFLKQVAREGGTATYAEVAPLAHLNMENPGDRVRIAQLLGDISAHEHAAGRPLLSVVVVLAESGTPGKGFFTLARQLGVYSASAPMGELAFFVRELARTHTYWRNHA